jgi:hypothetical protein
VINDKTLVSLFMFCFALRLTLLSNPLILIKLRIPVDMAAFVWGGEECVSGG